MALVMLLQNALVAEECPSEGPVLIVKMDETPEHAYGRVLEANVQSAPIVDERANKHIGFLDIRDLVGLLVRRHSDGEGDAVRWGLLKGTTELLADTIIDGVTVDTLARKKCFDPVPQSATLDDVAKQLSQVGCHRVPVVNGEGEIVDIVSQSTIIRFLDKNRDKLGKVGETTVGDAAKCGTAPVLAVRTDATVLDTLRVMAANDLLGLAVVDEASGRLVANTSASDFKQFLRDPSSTPLDTPIVDFLSRVRGRDVTAEGSAPVAVRPSDTLADVVARLAAARVHRLYVVGDGGEPVRVISLTDVMHFIYQQSYANFPFE